MLTLYVCAVALVAVILSGGKLRQLANVRIRHLWLVWLALCDQIIVISVIPDSHPSILSAAHLASYVAAGICLLLNRHLPGLWLIAIGTASNGLAITLNGGTLPASARALRASGWNPRPGHFHNSAVLPHPRLAVLGDIFATPAWLPGHDVFSLGDIAICLGVLWFLWHTCRRKCSDGSAGVPQEKRDWRTRIVNSELANSVLRKHAPSNTPDSSRPVADEHTGSPT